MKAAIHVLLSILETLSIFCIIMSLIMFLCINLGISFSTFANGLASSSCVVLLVSIIWDRRYYD